MVTNPLLDPYDHGVGTHQVLYSRLFETNPSSSIIRSRLQCSQNRQMFRPGIDRINRIISQLESRDRVTYLDITSALLEPDESLSKEVMPDFLNLSEDGYRRWTKAILPSISAQLAST